MQNKDFRVSVSKTKCFAQCKKQYEFNYIIKMPKKDMDYHIFGKFCHLVLEEFHKVYIPGSDRPYHLVMQESFKKGLAEYKQNMTTEMKKDCYDLIDEYLRILIKEKNEGKKLNVLAVERTFEHKISNNIILNGMIDRIQLDDDGILHVADYKTTKNKKYLVNDWFQLLTYCLVLMEEDPTIEKMRASYVLLRHNFEYVTAEFSRKEVMKVQQKYLDYVDGMRTEKEFPANPTNLCGWCPYLEHCPEGKAKAYDKVVFGEVAW